MVRACFVGLCLLATVGCHGVGLRRTARPNAWNAEVAPQWQPLTTVRPRHTLSQIHLAVARLENPAWERHAMHKIGRIGGWAVPRLTERLRHRDRKVRRAAAVGFACIWAAGDPAHVRPSMVRPKVHPDFTHTAVVALGAALDDIDDQVRMSAAFALGVIGADASPAAKALAAAAMDPLDKVAKQAIVALGRIGPEAAGEQNTLNEYIEPPGQALGEELIELFDENQNKRLRYYVALALMALNSDDEFWIPFTRGLSKGGVPGGDHRFANEWPGHMTRRIIRELEESDDWKVRRASALALGELSYTRPYEVRRALNTSRDDPDPRVRDAVGKALRRRVSGGREF
jgi:hypothetical protein